MNVRPHALRAARALAARYPDRKLACPVCVAQLKAENLDAHLSRVHDVAPTEAPPMGPVRWRGRDRWVLRVTLLGPALWAIGVLALALGGPPLSDAGVGLLVAALALALAPLIAAAAGLWPAELELEGHTLRLRLAAGTRRLEQRLPAPIRIGRLRVMKSDPVLSNYQDDFAGNVGQYEADGGVYLGFGEGPTLLVSSENGGGFRKRWAPTGWRPGPHLWRAHIELDRVAMAELELLLAEQGLLEPRE